MECFAAFLLVVTLFLVCMASVTSQISSGFGRRRLFQHLAIKFKGIYHAGGLFSGPSARLRYGSTWAVVSESKTVGPVPARALQVRLAWPHAHVRCEVVADVSRRLSPDYRFSWPPVTVGDDRFDPQYLIRGPDAAEVRQLLTSGVRWQIEQLRKLGETERLYILIREGQITIQKEWHRPRGEGPIQFVESAFNFYDQCMLAKASGIEFLHSDQAQTLDNVLCKVCGETITGGLVYCRRCKTPHHRECWAYAGSCSVFGCRETEFHLPVGYETDPDEP